MDSTVWLFLLTYCFVKHNISYTPALAKSNNLTVITFDDIILFNYYTSAMNFVDK